MSKSNSRSGVWADERRTGRGGGGAAGRYRLTHQAAVIPPEIDVAPTRGSIKHIIPLGAVVSMVETDIIGAEPWGDEARYTARFVPSRLAEFSTTRACARSALIRLGHAPVPIPKDANGAPVWPDGIVGSMTHCTGLRAAVVGSSKLFGALGIDAEVLLPLPPELLPLVTTPGERRMLVQLDDKAPDIPWGRLLFSAKESVYKAWYALGGPWLGFDECEIQLRVDSSTFGVRIMTGGNFAHVIETAEARWIASERHLFTTIVVSSEQRRWLKE